MSTQTGQQPSAGFRDYFSDGSQDYSRYRPRYPDDLFEYLASLPEEHDRAWDCATGSGQAAVTLAPWFDEVIATDASRNQIDNAMPDAGVIYRTEPAEQTSFEDHSVDLITVAQALHWFDIDAFTHEVSRVLKPDGVLAVWSYGLHRVTADVDSVVDHFYGPVLEGYWPPERRQIETGYAKLSFPLTPLESPGFDMTADWNMHQLTGYLRTWSSVKRYQHEKGNDPVDIITDELARAWGDPDEKKLISWPLRLRSWRNDVAER